MPRKKLKPCCGNCQYWPLAGHYQGLGPCTLIHAQMTLGCTVATAAQKLAVHWVPDGALAQPMPTGSTWDNWRCREWVRAE